MSVTSLSFTFVNMYAPPAAKTTAVRPEAPAKTETPPSEERRPGGGPNRLVQAMMTALRELGLGGSQSGGAAGASPAPATSTPPGASVTASVTPSVAPSGTAASTASSAAASEEAAPASAAVVGMVTESATEEAEAATASKPAETLESVVHQFAHELFRALRQIGRGESSDEGSGRIEGDRGHRHHHHHGHHGWRRHGYGDMSERLQALSQTFAAPAAVQSNDAAEAGATVSASLSITLTVQGAALPDTPVQGLTTAAVAMAGGTSSELAPEEQPAATEGASLARSEPAKNPLLDAFSKLVDMLKPQGDSGGETDIASKLSTFLQTLSDTMRPQSMRDIQTPQVGGLVNITA